MQQWPLQDAKNRFSQVVDNALRQGPQLVTRRGRATVVVLAVEEYQRLTRPTDNLADFLRKSPLKNSGLDIDRAGDAGREVEI